MEGRSKTTLITISITVFSAIPKAHLSLEAMVSCTKRLRKENCTHTKKEKKKRK